MNKKKNNGFLVAVVALLLLAVSVGYSLISKNYNFNGTANIGGNTWNIPDPDPDEIVEEPEPTPNPPKVECDETGTCTITYTANLQKPGDFYAFVTPIKNSGSIDAEISTVTTTIDNEAETSKYLKFEILTEDGQQLEGKELTANNGEIKVKVKVTYRDDNPDNLPQNDVSGIQIKTVVKLVQKTA